MFHRLLTLLILATGVAACGSPINNHCKSNAACEFSSFQGACISTWCAIPAEDCPSGWRFHDTAGQGLANHCAPSLPRDAGVRRDAGHDALAIDAPSQVDGALIDAPRADGPRRPETGWTAPGWPAPA